MGGNGKNLIALTFVALALFWLRTPLEGWAGTAPVRSELRTSSNWSGPRSYYW